MFNIACGVGFPLKIDPKSLSLDHGLFVRLFVDIDVEGFKPERILVTWAEQSSFIKIEYEKLLLYCSFCKFVGHNREGCRKQVEYKTFDNNVRLGSKEGMTTL